LSKRINITKRENKIKKGVLSSRWQFPLQLYSIHYNLIIFSSIQTFKFILVSFWMINKPKIEWFWDFDSRRLWKNINVVFLCFFWCQIVTNSIYDFEIAKSKKQGLDTRFAERKFCLVKNLILSDVDAGVEKTDAYVAYVDVICIDTQSFSNSFEGCEKIWGGVLYFHVLLHSYDPIFWSLMRGYTWCPPFHPSLCASMVICP
jgi:hypothetical protein